MIRKILSGLESQMEEKILEQKSDLDAVRQVKALIDQIDHEAETVPLNDQDRLLRLLVSLKGDSLTREETRILRLIIRD